MDFDRKKPMKKRWSKVPRRWKYPKKKSNEEPREPREPKRKELGSR